jgi:hypothetical protein
MYEFATSWDEETRLMSATLPSAVDAFTAALGADKVIADPEALREWRDPFQHESSDAYSASAVVMPTTVEEIQAILAIANAQQVPLWTHGQDRNNGYGGPAPRVAGSVIVSLRNMNRVLDINEELGYAVVEPGVRWFDLYEAIRAGGHMRFALYGDEPVVDHRFAKIKDAFETAIPGGAVGGTKHGPEAWTTLDAHEQVQAGIPNLGINAMTAWYGGEEGGHVGFSPVAPLTGRDALAVRDLMRPMIEEAGLDYFAGICPINGRSFAHVTLILFDLKDQAQSEQAYALSRRLVSEAGRCGYGEYRAHIDFMDLASDQYGFNDHAVRHLAGAHAGGL